MMDKQRRHFMGIALQLARENLDSKNGGPFGCIVVKDGKIIATGFNEVIKNNDPTCHAEIVAIRKACAVLNEHQLPGCEIYCSCEPCPMCLGAIYWARPDRYYYAASRSDAENAGFDDARIYHEFSLDHSQRQIPCEQLLKEKGAEVFREWKSLDLKIIY